MLTSSKAESLLVIFSNINTFNIPISMPLRNVVVFKIVWNIPKYRRMTM